MFKVANFDFVMYFDFDTKNISIMPRGGYNQESREITGLICTLTTAVTVPLSVTWGDAECDMCNTEQMTEE